MSDIYRGNLKNFILTFIGIDPAYNGAWWFFTTYIILVLISSVINKLIIKYNNIVITVFSLAFYFVAYVKRIKIVIVFDNEILNLGIRPIVLLGTSQLPFIVGMIVVHGIVQTLFVVVFIGIVFICVFNLMEKPKWINRLLDYLGNHSISMWFIHMFFYMIYFKDLVYGAKYSFLIFPLLIILCLISSYIVIFIYNKIMKLINNINSKIISNKKIVG